MPVLIMYQQSEPNKQQRGASIRAQRAPPKTTESWAAQGAQKYQRSANGSCWKPAATQGRADPQDGEQGNTEENHSLL